MADTQTTTNPSRSTVTKIALDMEDDIRTVENHSETLRLMAFGLTDITKAPTSAFIHLADEMEANANRLRDFFDRLVESTRSEKETPKKGSDAAGDEGTADIDASWSTAFRAVANMEEPETNLGAYVQLLHWLVDALDVNGDRDFGAAVLRLARDMTRELTVLDDLRGKAWRELHPNRDRFNREGWPGDKANQAGDEQPEEADAA